MNDVRPFEEYKEMIQDTSKEEMIKGLYDLSKNVIEKDQEIERLNNIINEFDKWLLGEQMMFYKSSDGERLIRFGETKYKWLELKGDSSNE